MSSDQIIRFKSSTFSNRNKLLNPKIMIYLLGFLYTLHITPAVYIDSSFLNQFIKSSGVGLIYSTASAATIVGIILARRYLQVFGNYITFKTTMIMNLLSFAFLSLHLIVETNIIWSTLFIIFFIIGNVSRTIGFLSIDIFLEQHSDDSETGGIRGIFLTSMNLSFVIGPMIASLLVTEASNAAMAYLWGTIFAIIILVISKRYFKNFKDAEYQKSHLFESYKLIKHNSDLSNIFKCNFILQAFYSVMVIYIPIFLYKDIGFNLGQVAMLIGISQIPFLLLQIPMGKLADKVLGEKELLTGGFILAAITTFLITLFDMPNFLLWAVILFSTRIGIAAVELMTESYLFKKIDSSNINILGLYRIVRPAAYIVTPIIASVVLYICDIKILFLITSFILITATWYSSKIVDTR